MLPQVSSKHCRILRIGARDVTERFPEMVRMDDRSRPFLRPATCGLLPAKCKTQQRNTHAIRCSEAARGSNPTPYAARRGGARKGLPPVCRALLVRPDAYGGRAQVEVARADPTVLACVIDTSTNGTWLNGAKLEKGVAAPLRHDDLLCFASPDVNFDKCVAFRFHRHDPELLAAGPSAGDAPPAKRARPSSSASDPALALDLHAVNQGLRAKVNSMAEQVTLLQAKLTNVEAAAQSKILELEQQLAGANAAAARQQEEAAQAAAAERAVFETRIGEVLASVDAEKARLAAATTAASEAESAAAHARSERDATHARIREVEASLDEARAKLRAECDAIAQLNEALAARDAALATERAEKEAAQRRAEHAATDAAAATTALAAEHELRIAAEAAFSAAQERATAFETRLARLQEETRGIREGSALEMALQQKLFDHVRSMYTACTAVMPVMAALEQKHAAAATAERRASFEPVNGGALQVESQRCTQRIIQSVPPPSAAPAPPLETQHMEVVVPEAGAREEGGAKEASVPAVLPPVEEDEEEPAEEMAGGDSDDENDMYVATFPSASLQAQMEAEAAAAKAELLHKSESQPMADADANAGGC